jgi:putative oxidoreductase
MTTLAHDRTGTALASATRLRATASADAQAAALPTAARLNAALATLRVIAATVFLAHGAQKLFVFGLAGVTAAFEGMGVPLAGFTAPAVALVELLGGLALIAGLFTRVAALGLAITMLGAMVLVHLPAGFFLPNGIEFTLTLVGAAVALALTGPGRYSLDAAVASRRIRG